MSKSLIGFGEVQRNRPIPDSAADRQHLVCHHRGFFHRVACGLDRDRRQVANRHHAPSIVRLEAAHVHFVIRLCAFGEPFEFVACAVSGDEIADRAGRITSRSRIPAPLDFGEKPCRVLDRVGQFDPLALAVGVSSGIPIIVGVGLSAFFADGFGLYPFRQRHAGFPFSGQISTLHAWPHRWCPMPSGWRVYGLRLPSASGECPKGTCRTMEAGGLPSPIGPKCLSKLAIRPLRFPGRHRPASDRPEASCPSCALSFGLTGGRSSCRGRGRTCVFANRENVGRVDHPEHHAQARPKVERRL